MDAAAAPQPADTAAESLSPAGVTEDEREGLRHRVAGGVRWKLLSQGVGQLSRTVVGIILARMLTPEEFGLAAMALVFTGLTTIFTDLSLGAALVQRPRITERDRSTVFWTSVAASVVVATIWVGISPLVGDFFSTPGVTPLFAATAASALLWGVAGTQIALLTRALDFRSLELREIGATLVGGIAAVALAAGGAGAWAIVGQNLVIAAVSAALVWRLSSWRPRFTYSRASLRTLGSFGGKTLLARLLSYANLTGDNLLIGRFLGSASLGIYSIAYSVMFLPASRIAAPIQQVLFPAFARMQHDHVALRRTWIRGTQLVAAVNAAAFLGMVVVAPDFVPVVLGEKWIAAVPVLQLLSLAGVAQSVQTLNWSVLQAVGASGRLLRFMTFSTAVTVSAFVVGLHWGVVGVAGFYALARVIVGVVYAWTTCRRIGLPQLDYARGIARIARLAFPMAVLSYLVRIGLVSAGVPAGWRLLLVTAFGAVVYFLLVRWRAPDLLAEIRRMLLPGLRAAGLRGRSRSEPQEGCLTPALRTLARRSTLAVELDAQPLPVLPDEVEVVAYSVVSEALRCAAEDSGVSAVQVSVERREGMLRVTVVDDGAAGTGHSRRPGLGALRGRIERLGGTLEVERPGCARVTAILPLLEGHPVPAEHTERAAVAIG